jgi:RNA polymerase sigma-70 factor (ECF subfamily)
MFSRKQSANDSVSENMASKQKRYEAMVNTLHTDIYRYAYWLVKDKHVAEDIVQETFLRAWKSLDSLKDPKAAKSCFERKQFDLVDMDDVPLEDEGLSNETEIEHRELRKLMAELNEEYREPLMLQILFGYSGDEIAEQLDLNKNTVMTRLFRARNQLKESLEKANNDRGVRNG